MTDIFVLETFNDEETQGVCSVFSSQEAAIAGAVAMVKRGWTDFDGLLFLVAKMGLDNDNHTFDTTNVFRFGVDGETIYDVEYCTWNGWVRK